MLIDGSKITNLTADSAPTVDDLVPTVNDPLGTPANRKVTLANLATVMPGYVLAYTEFTTDVSPTATSEGTANSVVTAPALTFDGATAIKIEFFTWRAKTPTVGAVITFVLYADSVSIGIIGQLNAVAAVSQLAPIYLVRCLTPVAGTITYSIRVYVSSTTGSPAVYADVGGVGHGSPGFIRITRA